MDLATDGLHGHPAPEPGGGLGGLGFAPHQSAFGDRDTVGREQGLRFVFIKSAPTGRHGFQDESRGALRVHGM